MCPLHPLPQLALLGSARLAPEGHLPQLLHALPVPGLEALQAPALQEALLGRLLALLQDLLLVLQLRAHPALRRGLRGPCWGHGCAQGRGQSQPEGNKLCCLLQVLTVPMPVLPSELLPAAGPFLILIPLINLVLLLPLLIAGTGGLRKHVVTPHLMLC